MTISKNEVNQMKPHQWTDGGTRVLILRRCNSDMTSYGGFKWPETGIVECPPPNPDYPKQRWIANNECGNGLHGWAWGMGMGDGADYSIIDDKWVVVAVMPDDIVGEIGGSDKCKFSRGEIIHCGAFSGAWALVNSGRHRLIEEMAKVGDVIASGNYSKAASSGDSSKAASSGDSSTAASSGNSSTAASSGNYSKAASSGDSSTAASSGNYSKAEARGENTIAACAGHGGRVMVGSRGAFAIAYWSDVEGYRFLTGKVGENGIKPDTSYCVINGVLTEC